MKDQMNQIHPVRSTSPVSVADNTAQAGQLIDRMVGQGFESLTYLIATGSLADVDATFAATMTHGDLSDGSDQAAVASTDLVGTLALASFTFADDDKCFKVGYVGGKRYVKLTITPSNNASAALICVIALLGHCHATPTANPPSAA